MSENKYGTATIGYNTKEEREIPILNYLQAEFKDNRLCTISQTDSGKGGEEFIIMIENPSSSGRNTSQQMYLSKESLLALLSSSFLYFMAKNENITDMLQTSIDNKDIIDYRISDNLTLIKNKENGK